MEISKKNLKQNKIKRVPKRLSDAFVTATFNKRNNEKQMSKNINIGPGTNATSLQIPHLTEELSQHDRRNFRFPFMQTCPLPLT